MENLVTCPKEHAYEASKLIEELSIASGDDLAVRVSCDLGISDVWYCEEYTFDENHNLVKRG